MKLTRRQLDLLGIVHSLQQENNGAPIHYSALSERIDVSNSTAYNVLQLLTEKGCLKSSYHFPEKRSGRSSIAYELTGLGRQILASSGDGRRQSD